MPDSNEMNTNPKHPRLRASQAGLKAQEEDDKGGGLTSESYANIMNDLMLDILNDRIDRGKALAAIAAGNQIVQVAKLELQNREMILRYQYKHESEIETPEPLRLAPKKKRVASR